MSYWNSSVSVRYTVWNSSFLCALCSMEFPLLEENVLCGLFCGMCTELYSFSVGTEIFLYGIFR